MTDAIILNLHGNVNVASVFCCTVTLLAWKSSTYKILSMDIFLCTCTKAAANISENRPLDGVFENRE